MKVYIIISKDTNCVVGVVEDLNLLADLPNTMVETLELDFDPTAKSFYMVVWPTRVNNQLYAQSVKPSLRELFYLNTVRFNRYAYVLAHNEYEAVQLAEALFKEAK